MREDVSEGLYFAGRETVNGSPELVLANLSVGRRRMRRRRPDRRVPAGWRAGSPRYSARVVNGRPPKEISLVKAGYRKDVGLPGSGCYRPGNLLS